MVKRYSPGIAPVHILAHIFLIHILAHIFHIHIPHTYSSYILYLYTL